MARPLVKTFAYGCSSYHHKVVREAVDRLCLEVVGYFAFGKFDYQVVTVTMVVEYWKTPET